ncbi:Fe-S oxidoreductase [Bryocella elongata]|uniref:Fe-S oxidoreductase n=1 Tax=Bryocella elongata TaxID=863522 RepID=A0A1H5XZL8_9BACT|nr:(Fe-S)-binding protein [Bryocella elongata]SEG16726.1 Fe-S oxidoreductase [Bryocella elongata]
MLSPIQSALFLLFAVVCLAAATRGFLRLYRRIRRGQRDTDTRLTGMPQRIGAALWLTLTQQRTFKRRPWVSFFHALIFYGFVVYLAVNAVDAVEGFSAWRISSASAWGAAYNLIADLLSALVLIGVCALVFRRFALASRRDFRFNPRTMLHKDLRDGAVSRDSLMVSAFILVHVGGRALSAGAKLVIDGGDVCQPFASLIARFIPAARAQDLAVTGYWLALGSVLAFLVYFPYSKHLHLLMAPLKYAVAREERSGVLPAMDLAPGSESELRFGAERLEDLAWPRLLDAYACIQCNRCQDACPATATGKALSPAALEINKRMELNTLARAGVGFEQGGMSPRPLLRFALSPEAAWACTTCGACIKACPVGDEPLFDIIDVRRQQVMMAGEFPQQLQGAFRGMERAGNPWGIAREQRMDWARGLDVPTLEQKPEAELLYWVGCAASYDPQAQKTARAFVQLLTLAGVEFAVLGKRECCTGDPARRAGNEYLYQQLATENVRTLDAVKTRRIVVTCPHCLNSLGQEYRQLGGDYEVVHHTELLASLVAEGRLRPRATGAPVAFHDPCYLGRHNGVYEAPRNVLHVLSDDVRELPRSREQSFCCGAGGAQFWKEEEPGDEPIAANRLREAAEVLRDDGGEATLAVGCPFCKSMLTSAPGEVMQVRDVAELLWEAVGPAIEMRASSSGDESVAALSSESVEAAVPTSGEISAVAPIEAAVVREEPPPAPVARAKWQPKLNAAASQTTPMTPIAATTPSIDSTRVETEATVEAPTPTVPERKKWTPRK